MHVDARDERRPGGARHAEGGQAESAVDERPVGGGIQQVGGDEGEGDRRHDVHPLQVAPHRGVEQQRQRAPQHDAEVALEQRLHVGVEAGVRNGGHHAEADGHDRHRQARAHRQAVHEPAVAVAVVAGAVGLRHERVEAQQQAHAEDGDGHVNRGADAGRADGRRAERRHHDGVHDTHRHPPQFGEHDRQRQAQHRGQFGAE
jgi:hypothetical protein